MELTPCFCGTGISVLMAWYRACVRGCRLQGSAVISWGWRGCELPHASQSCLRPTMGCMEPTTEKNSLCTKTCPLSTKISSNHRPTVPLSTHSSERNRQLLEAEDKLLWRGVSASKEGTYNPGGLWRMDNPCWSRDTPEGTAAHQCPRQEQGHWGRGQQKPLSIEKQRWLRTQ